MLAALCAVAVGFVGTAMADLTVGFNPAGPGTATPGSTFNVDLIVNGPDATDQPSIGLRLNNTAGTNTAGVIFQAGTPATYTASSWNGPALGTAGWANVGYGNNGTAGGGAGRQFVLSGTFNALAAPGPNQFIATLNIVIPAGTALGTYRISVFNVDFTTQGGTGITGPTGQFFQFQVVPEPSSIILSCVGLVGGLGVWAARRRNSKKEEVTIAA